MIRQMKQQERKGMAAVELALLLPFLAFLLVASVDFARVFYFTSVMRFCARDGCLYASQNPGWASSDVKNAAQLDESSQALTVANPTTGTDSNGNATVTVTVTFTFKTITSYPGIPSSIALSRSCTMRTCQSLPN